MAGRKAAEAVGAPAWMATFADMMSLLLTFFILLLSFAEMDIVKFKDALGSIQESLGVMKASSSGDSMIPMHNSSMSINMSIAPPPISRVLKTQSSSCSKAEGSAGSESVDTNKEIVADLTSAIDAMKLEEEIQIENTNRGVVMRVKGRMFFNPGTAELKLDSHPIFQTISELMRKFPKEIAIEGHTDNVPTNGGKYANNWELSTARAFTALKFLQEYEGIEINRIHIAGFGDTKPLASNETPEGRSENRRVEFVFYQ